MVPRHTAFSAAVHTQLSHCLFFATLAPKMTSQGACDNYFQSPSSDQPTLESVETMFLSREKGEGSLEGSSTSSSVG